LLKNAFVVFAAPKQGETLLNPSDLQKTAVFCLTPEKHLDDVFRCSQAIMRRLPQIALLQPKSLTIRSEFFACGQLAPTSS